MESRDDNDRKRERVKVSDEKVEEEKPKIKKSSKPETVRLVLQRNLRLKITGPISGKDYFFAGAGAIVDVNKEDADIMIEKHGGLCCEGSGTGKPPSYFGKV
jgi:hypothetical protein